MLKFWLTFAVVCLFASQGFCQDTQQLIGEVAEIYTGGDASGGGLILGFSLWGLIGGILFSCIGFVAFVYGKRNTEFRPMLIGIGLMAYPYFLRGTLALYLVGIALTAALYFFRE
jgi:hypothetical protein